MADPGMTQEDWIKLVLADLGAPASPNNITNMTAWMAAENSWPPPRNNPLNNGLGSGGGSGLGSYPDLTTAAHYAAQALQGGVTGAAPMGQALVADAPFSTFHQASINATWSGDHYAGTSWLNESSPGNVTPSATAGGTAGSGTAAAAGAPATTPTRSETVNGMPVTGTDTQLNALTSTQQLLDSFGLGSMTDWAWKEITSGADPTVVSMDLQNTPEFAARFPGIQEQKFFNGVNPQNPTPVISVQDYLSYETTAYQAAQAMGLPPGFMTKEEIGKLIGGRVSLNELNARLNDVYQVASTATPDVKNALNAYFGYDISPGGLAALALDPTKAEPILKQQVTAAQIGGAGTQAGVGQIGSGEALKLAQAGVTSSDALNAAKQVAPLAPLETALPGLAHDPTVNPGQLMEGQLLGTASDVRQLQVTQETRKAPFTGGGGSVSTQAGVVGAGSASGTGPSK